MKRKYIGSLEKQSDIDNPSWIPQVGEYYAWREHTTRRGRLQIGQVIGYDSEKKIVRGRLGWGPSEHRYLSDVFKLPEAVALNTQ